MPIRFQVDHDFYDHPKVLGMSDAAFALWVRAGSYSAAKTSDGFVAEDALSLFSATQQEAAQELVQRGLWRRVKGGYRFHQWDHRNLTRARVEADREADRQRKRRDRKTAQQNGKPQVEPGIVRPDSIPDSARNPPGVRPVSVSVSVSESVSGSGRGEPASRCPQHADDPDPPNCGRCADARKTHDRWEAERPTPNRLSGSPDFDAIEQAAARGTRRGQLAAQARAAVRSGQITEETT